MLNPRELQIIEEYIGKNQPQDALDFLKEKISQDNYDIRHRISITLHRFRLELLFERDRNGCIDYNDYEIKLTQNIKSLLDFVHSLPKASA